MAAADFSHLILYPGAGATGRRHPDGGELNRHHQQAAESHSCFRANVPGRLFGRAERPSRQYRAGRTLPPAACNSARKAGERDYDVIDLQRTDQG